MKILAQHKKLLSIVSLIIIAAAVALVFIKYKYGDVWLVLLHPQTHELVEQIEKQSSGEKIAFPLKLPEGYKIGVFAKDLGAARDLQFSPAGVLLVSSFSSGKVLALPDNNSDGRADSLKEILTGLDKPHGLAFYKNYLFVAEYTQVVRYTWDEANLAAKLDKKIIDLPGNAGHQTRSLLIKDDGTLYVSIGSTCNVCLEGDPRYASVIVSDFDGKGTREFIKGSRNAVFLALNPKTNEVWATENSRDLLGDNIPPDEINILRDGKNYGWPICYADKIHDTEFDKNQYVLDPCIATTNPIFKIQAHSAPLGLTFINSSQFPGSWQGDLLVSYHGSWNRSIPTGYKIVRLKVAGNKILNQEDFITGFIPANATSGNDALGRPVDLTFDKSGSLYISDDRDGAVYKLVKN